MRKAGEVEPVTQEVRQDLVILGNALLRAPSSVFRQRKAEEPFRGSGQGVKAWTATSYQERIAQAA